jgi:hypothetical protein
MVALGILNQVEGYTFVYSGNLQLGDKNYIVVAFETNPRSGTKKFEIKIVESKSEMDIVIKTFLQKPEDVKPKKSFDWSSGNVTDAPLPPVKPKPNKTLDMFQ